MLLSSRMASIPRSPRHSVSYTRDIEHLFKRKAQNSRVTFPPQPAAVVTSGLQYFNMRVTRSLHRYRSMKKQWQEVAASVQNTSLSPTCESPSLQDPTKNSPIQTQKSTGEAKCYCINDYISSTTTTKDYADKNSIELDPLHSRIQQDLIKLRKFIKAKQRKFGDNPSYKTPTSSSRPSGEAASISTAFDDQLNHNITVITKSSSVNKLKPLDRVKIAGCQMRPPVLLKSDSADSGVGSTSNTSSTCSQYPKQQQQQQQKHRRDINNKIFNIYHSRVNPVPPPLPSDSFYYRSSYASRKKFHTLSRMSQSMPPKQLLPSRLSASVSPVIEKKQPSFTKQEIPLPPIQRSERSDDITTRLYTYAAPSSTATPRSMMLKRSTSLLPILLQSSSCVGIQPREVRLKKVEFDLEEEQEETNNDDDDYYHLLNYNHLINRLPKPIISIFPRYGQDDYGVLFEQLDHIRETMPDSNTYDDYARIV